MVQPVWQEPGRGAHPPPDRRNGVRMSPGRRSPRVASAAPSGGASARPCRASPPGAWSPGLPTLGQDASPRL